MKNSFLLLSALLFPAAISVMAAVAPSVPSAYDQAVKSYVDSAGDQLRAIRTQADAEVGPTSDDAVKRRYAKAYAQLDECDRILVELKTAGPADFDKVKARFEAKRAEMLKALETARKS
ncbi:MAG TPA: hypothetical protein VG838_13125 [Opitutaceae bacterium]|nr:hypothetical protein [Opitutaceae bacterium]